MARSTKSTTTTRKSTSAGRTTKSRSRSTTTKQTSTTKADPTPVEAPVEAPAAAPVVSLVPDASRASGYADAPNPAFRRPDLLDAVAERSELKRPQVKAVMDLVLDELGKALDARDTVVLPPFGKLVVKGRKDAASATVLTTKIRRNAPQSDTATGLADSDGEG